jgi:DNA (cytosine-5)-methyltransferase 1
LLFHFGRLVEELRPDIVSMENVPSLERFADGAVFDAFKDVLKNAGYDFVSAVVCGTDFGLPQSRSRLVLIASRLGSIEMPLPFKAKRTIREAIGTLPVIKAGDRCPTDPLHQASGLTPTNLKRMRASKPGGTWNDWPEALRLTGHRRPTGNGNSAEYGRLSWDEPAPTITTQFYNYGSGRFGHPEQDRALSLREGAILQGFPPSYEFVPRDASITMTRVARMIGNAVPVHIAQAIARTVKAHIKDRV